MHKFVVLISGAGSNLNAMCKAGLAPHIAAVISNKPDAFGITIAAQYNIPTHIIEHKNFNSRKEFDQELRKQIEQYTPMFVVLAGFMRILSTEFVGYYPNRLLNIHPSILPAFVGAEAIPEAVQKKVKITGVTVHFVTNDLDSGPIIAQSIVPVRHDDTENTLKTRIHELEHVIYPFVIKKYLKGQISIRKDNTVIVKPDNDDIILVGKFQQQIFY